MKKLGISLVAILVGLPMMAQAADIAAASTVSLDSGNHVAGVSFVQGAYNAAIGEINTNRTQINANTTAIAGKQAQLTNGTADVSNTVATTVRATGSADNTTLVTEAAVRAAIDNAGGQTAAQVEDAIDAAAGAGIATNNSGKLSLDLTSNGGLELTGSGDAATVGVKVDGTHVVKDASGNVTLSQTDIDNLTAAGTALQASDIATGSTAGTISVDGTDVAVNGVLTDASAFATAAQGTKADSALQKADITTGGANGTIAVDGTDVAVKGLGTAAYAATTDFDASGTAAGLVGTLSNLDTSTKTDVVSAINEVKDSVDTLGSKQVQVYTTWNTTSTGKAAALVDPDPVVQP